MPVLLQTMIGEKPGGKIPISGVMYTSEGELLTQGIVQINATLGHAEGVVTGKEPSDSFFIFGEVLTLTQWLGTGLVVTGASIAARPRSLHVDRSLSFALIASLMTALSAVIIKVAGNFASLPIVLFAYSLQSVLFLPLLMKNALPRLRTASQYVVSSNLPASAINLITMYALVTALHLGPAGTTTGIFQGMSMLAVASGVLFLGERDHKVSKLVAAAITTIGIFLLI
jgi:drug/metabolite transporter (DMT)-like permease